MIHWQVDERNIAKIEQKALIQRTVAIQFGPTYFTIGNAQKSLAQKEIKTQRNTYEWNKQVIASERTTTTKTMTRKEAVLSMFIVHNILTVYRRIA